MLCTNNLINEKRKFCLFCGKEIIGGDCRKKFCNNSCAASYNNKKRGKHSEETKNKIALSMQEKNKEHKIVKNKKSSYKVKHIKDRLFRDGVKEYKCEICGISSWNGKDLVLQLHHINGNHYDNDIDNLQILCPNCHSQTDNFCIKNRKQKYEKAYCVKCGVLLKEQTRTGMCLKCYREYQKNNNKPTKEELIQALEKYVSYNKVSNFFNVSSKRLHKWIKEYNL